MVTSTASWRQSVPANSARKVAANFGRSRPFSATRILPSGGPLSPSTQFRSRPQVTSARCYTVRLGRKYSPIRVKGMNRRAPGLPPDSRDFRPRKQLRGARICHWALGSAQPRTRRDTFERESRRDRFFRRGRVALVSFSRTRQRARNRGKKGIGQIQIYEAGKLARLTGVAGQLAQWLD